MDVQCKSNILVMDNIITLCLRDIHVIIDYIITLCLLDIIIKKNIITMFVGYNYRKTEPHFVGYNHRKQSHFVYYIKIQYIRSSDTRPVFFCSPYNRTRWTDRGYKWWPPVHLKWSPQWRRRSGITTHTACSVRRCGLHNYRACYIWDSRRYSDR